MWQQLVDQKEQWIGGKLIEYGDSMDRNLLKLKPIETELLDITLDEERIMFIGKDFQCGGSREYMGISGSPQFSVPANGLAIEGYGGHEFHITKHE
jgi:hypothetical protein